MIPNQDPTTLLMPVRRRSVTAVPVLIQIPNLATSRSPQRRVRRRRLRREVRLVGYTFLVILPISMGFASFHLGLHRLTPLAASSLPVSRDPEASRLREAPAVSLSLEPIASPALSRDPETPVLLQGILLPAEPTEGAGHGRH